MQTLRHREDRTTPVRRRDRVRQTIWQAMRRFPFQEPEFSSRKVAARAAFWMLIAASALFGVMLGLMLTYSVNLPEMAELEHYRPSTTTELLDIHGKVFGTFALERRIVVPYSEFPPVLRDAITSIEDKNFFTNSGVNLGRVAEAAWDDLHSDRKAQGASTLTMQLARNLFLSSEKTYGRKLKEIFLTLQIERHFTKPQIFTLYANQIYLGSGVYGFEAGSEYYFSKHARDLTLPEAALLAALPKGPEEFSPIRHPERALARRNLVLQAMVDNHKITAEQAEQAMATPLGLHIEPATNTEAPYFVEEVRRELDQEYGADEGQGAGLRVYTTLDLNLQRAANKAVLDGVAAYEHRRGWQGHLQNVLLSGDTLDGYKHPDWIDPIVAGAYFHALVMEVSPSHFTVRIGQTRATLTPADWAWTQATRATQLVRPGDIVYVRVDTKPADGEPHLTLEQDSGAQASMMAVDNSNGEVLAMVGGRDFQLSQFNRATQSERQVGSSFKPYDYTAAMEAGMTPNSIVLDEPTTFYTASGPYTPHNYEKNWRGPMTLTAAFAESRNIPALRLADKLGIKKVIEVARRFGVTSPLPNYLPVAIGAAGITLEQQVASYSVFPNDGIRIAPHFIRRVTQADGVPLRQKLPEVREVISTEIAREMMVLFKAVINMPGGTGEEASSLHHALGGKTGTTNNFTDAWFIGFSPSITCGTWVGFDNPAQSLGDKETGARAALPIWMGFMKVALADRPNEQFATYTAPRRQLAVPLTSPSAAGQTPDEGAAAATGATNPAAPAATGSEQPSTPAAPATPPAGTPSTAPAIEPSTPATPPPTQNPVPTGPAGTGSGSPSQQPQE